MSNDINTIKRQLNEAAERKDNDTIDKIFGELSEDEIGLLGWACTGDYGTCDCSGYERSSPPNGTCSICKHYAYEHKH